MWIKESVTKTEEVNTGFQCNKCGSIISQHDLIEWQEKFACNFEGGYGSLWGDGTKVEIHLCQNCLYVLLGPYASYE